MTDKQADAEDAEPVAPTRIRRPRLDPELVIGLVGPIGADLRGISEAVCDALLELNYTPVPIKLSAAMCAYEGVPDPVDKPLDERYDEMMDRGTTLREKFGRGDILALLGVLQIRDERAVVSREPQLPAPRHAYIVDSLKNPAEVRTLREIYGDSFFLLAAYAPRVLRVEQLATRIAASRHGARASDHRSAAERLVNKDESERDEHNQGIKLGQNVQDVFHIADAFVDARNYSSIQSSVERALHLLFGHPFRTPTRDEQGMYFAKSAALRSSSMARQVGAAITSMDGDLKSVGANEVPKPGGGMYWEGDDPDDRDFTLGEDVSDTYKRKLVADILARLARSKWLSWERAGQTIDELTEAALAAAPNRGPMKGARVMDVLEFVRASHAEMAAITDAARRGIPLRGDTIYVTTFPCHECARLILASGIARVVYIEPYPKSLAAELYPNAVRIESSDCVDGKVSFEPFIGIAPRRYLALFEMIDDSRKDPLGRAIRWVPEKAQPRVSATYPVHPLTESDAILELEALISEKEPQLALDFLED
jgi:deoxycytidylate deaminase